MKTVGVKQLKARLSEYLRAVKRGEVVVVTERGQVVAELKPAKDRELPEDVRETLDALARAGEVTRAAAAKKGWRWTTPGLGLNPGTAARMLDELRADAID